MANRGRRPLIVFRASRRTHDLFKAAAAADGKSLSGWLRGLAVGRYEELEAAGKLSRPADAPPDAGDEA